MKCPKCKKELKNVNIYSMCCQWATLQDNRIVEYGEINAGDYDIQDIECPYCYESIIDDIEI